MPYPHADMTHLNLIVPMVLILALCVGICLCATSARDMYDEISVRADRYRRHPALAYVILGLCAFVAYGLARLLMDTVAFVAVQLLA